MDFTITNSVDINLNKLQKIVKVGEPGVLHAVHGVAKGRTQLSN